jgi:hypothetical protein
MLILARHYVAFLVRMFATPEQDFEVLDEHFSGCFGAVHLSNAKPLILDKHRYQQTPKASVGTGGKS